MNNHINEHFEESIVYKKTVYFHIHGFALEAKAGIQALHVTLSVDYREKWYIPNQITNTIVFPELK